MNIEGRCPECRTAEGYNGDFEAMQHGRGKVMLLLSASCDSCGAEVNYTTGLTRT